MWLQIMINVLIGIGLVLAMFVLLYFVWGVIVSMYLTKYFKFIKLRKKETEANRKLSELEVKMSNTEDEKEKLEKERDQLLLGNYELKKQQLEIQKEITKQVKELNPDIVLPDTITVVPNHPAPAVEPKKGRGRPKKNQ